MSEQTYYPSCVVNIQVTFERKLWLREDIGNNQFRTTSLVTSQNNGTFILNRVPKKMTCNMKGHTQAATWSLIFDYRELPIDPRTIHASTVEIYLGTVSAEQFADGMKREWRPGVRRSILQTRTPDGKAITEQQLLVGPVDEWKIDYGKDGAEVRLEGRDLRGLLLDSPMVSARDAFDYGHGFPRRTPDRKRTSILNRLNTKQNIVDLVQQILSEHDRLRELEQEIEVIAYKDEWPNGVILSPGAGSHIPRHRRGANGQGSNAGGGHEQMNFWDAITRYCWLVGAIPRFIGRKLEIRYAPNLYTMVEGANRGRVPFANGESRRNGFEDEWFVRRLVYGRDVDTMGIARKYAGHNKPKIVRVIALNPSHRGRGRQQLLEAVWPPRNAKEAKAEGLRGGRKELRDYLSEENAEILNIPVQGVTNMAQLVSIAQSYYEQIGRQEMTAEVSLDKVTSFGGNNADPDVLRIRVGDPIELLVDATKFSAHSPIVSTLNRTATMTFAEAVAEVRQFLPDENLARAIVASARGNIMGVLRYFRVGEVNYDFTQQDGVTIKADLQNYWTPAYDPNARLPPSNRQRNHADVHRGDRAARTTAASTGGSTAMIPMDPSGIASRPMTFVNPDNRPDLDATTRATGQPAEPRPTMDEVVTESRRGEPRWRL